MRLVLGFIFVFFTFVLLSQETVNPTDTTGLVRYSPEFKFADGIFISFEQVKINKPLPVTRLISDDDTKDVQFFANLVAKEEIVFVDDFGVVQTISTSTIWGYSRNGFLYINHNSEFNRIPVIGAISHFVADQTVIHDRQMNPNGYNSYYPTNSTYSTKEIRQFILDFETGKIMQFTRNNLEIILVRDNELYTEYMELKKSQRKNRYFLYLRRYNERNSLYFPKQK